MNFHEKMPLHADHGRVIAKTRDYLFAGLVMLLMSIAITGCSGGDAPPPTTPSTPSSSSSTIGSFLYLSTSKTSILTDGIDSATITATVLESNIAQANVTVTFSATGGVLNSAEAITDADGKATVTFKSGPFSSNQIVNITATSPGATATIPVQITGNDISLTIPQNSMGTSTSQTLTSSLQNAIPIGISNATVTFTILSGSGIVSLSSTDVTSDFEGEASITVTGVSVGTAIIQASSLGASAQITITIAAAAQVFEITSPTTSPANMATDSSLVFTVNAPNQTQVIFHTSLGAWNNLTTTETINVVGGVATATLTSSDAGLANIVVYDVDAPATQDIAEVNIFAPASQAAKLTLQASQTNVAPTPVDSTTKNSVTLTATVKTSGDQVVGGAVVNFTITDPVGGGEQVSPASVQTNSSGVATTTFYSGSLSSDSNGITITATIDVGGVPVTSSETIIIGGQAGSIAMGRANKVIPSGNNTSYDQVITVHVTDAAGNPVALQTVSLNLWPTHYLLGSERFDEDGNCVGYGYDEWPRCSGMFLVPNEDANRNLILDAGEDTGPYNINESAMLPNGNLTPRNSAAGSVPATVTTDQFGKAEFNITYLKLYSYWTRVELQASVVVLGTETQASLSWELDPSESDFDGCDLFRSPFGYYSWWGPWAYAGPDQTVSILTPLQLDGTSTEGSCSGNLPTSISDWAWIILSKPTGSSASLLSANTSTPTFTPDVAGEYVLRLTVTDAGSFKDDDRVTITAN